MESIISKRPETTLGENKLSEKEIHLLEALLHLLLYIGGNETSDIVEKTKGLVFTSGSNPPTRYGTPKYGMGG